MAALLRRRWALSASPPAWLPAGICPPRIRAWHTACSPSGPAWSTAAPASVPRSSSCWGAAPAAAWRWEGGPAPRCPWLPHPGSCRRQWPPPLFYCCSPRLLYPPPYWDMMYTYNPSCWSCCNASIANPGASPQGRSAAAAPGVAAAAPGAAAALPGAAAADWCSAGPGTRWAAPFSCQAHQPGNNTELWKSIRLRKPMVLLVLWVLRDSAHLCFKPLTYSTGTQLPSSQRSAALCASHQIVWCADVCQYSTTRSSLGGPRRYAGCQRACPQLFLLPHGARTADRGQLRRRPGG
jgi:hypothetical protein